MDISLLLQLSLGDAQRDNVSLVLSEALEATSEIEKRNLKLDAYASTYRVVAMTYSGDAMEGTWKVR